MDTWLQLRTICDPALSEAPAITTLAFDPYQELLWAGNDKGQVTSYFGGEMNRYTSFRAHLNDVRQLLVSDRGVISLSSDTVKMVSRRGLVKWSISYEDTTDLHCMSYTTMPHTEILAAGKQQNILVINVARGTVVKKVESESEIVVMKKSRLVCCGASSGEVTLRDPRTFKVEHRIQAHTGAISDIDTSGNLLLTCGFSSRHGNLVIDPLVKVYDIRTMRPLVPIPFPSGPYFLKMHPKLSTTAFMVSRTGQFHVCDIGNNSAIHFYQANTTSFVNAIDISTSGEMLSFGDSASFIHLWCDREDYGPIEKDPDALPASINNHHDIIFVKDLKVSTIIGVNPWEREEKQIVILNLTTYPSFPVSALQKDHVTKPHNYRTIVRTIIKHVEQSKYKTVEAFATAVARIAIIELH
ncbi:2238_t:CDS:2 [Entrophospora sp. SA101]|nr:2238_t:CDS:2 [Entrophospora sp. SA101]